MPAVLVFGRAGTAKAPWLVWLLMRPDMKTSALTTMFNWPQAKADPVAFVPDLSNGTVLD